MIITIGGRAGGGKSSVARALAKKLGYKFYSAGDVRRKYARDKNITLSELNEQAKKDPTSDYLVDDYMKKMAEKIDNFVIDAWLGFYFFPDSIKIFLEADIKVRAKRLFERQNFEEHPDTLKEAINTIGETEKCSLARFEKLYGVNAYDHNHFDLVVDTSNNTVEQTTEQAYKFVMHQIKK
ncbi:hypothetical protein AYK26_04335 [Euryarchaeota archaeon SM23-78]|nr:MAG: hypothetical protein AYK26_04335 [Euryarchaeota archaeon SM23-78]